MTSPRDAICPRQWLRDRRAPHRPTPTIRARHFPCQGCDRRGTIRDWIHRIRQGHRGDERRLEAWLQRGFDLSDGAYQSFDLASVATIEQRHARAGAGRVSHRRLQALGGEANRETADFRTEAWPNPAPFTHFTGCDILAATATSGLPRRLLPSCCGGHWRICCHPAAAPQSDALPPRQFSRPYAGSPTAWLGGPSQAVGKRAPRVQFGASKGIPNCHRGLQINT